AAALLDEAGKQRLPGLARTLAAVNDWSVEALEAAVRGFAETHGLKLGQAAQPLRAALTGRAMSPGLFDVMAVLGREETLARLADQS
ncbi:MAG: glutamate--tRNA ligase, partial [Bosea sp. 32-68-6]